ncbi:helix-turn-helix transcriptional regulator [Cytophagaceae bacterium ABcell3]|nr:helix-turn-helix transcriptional regulator [Cytophagaceae bacterium ABcell3]
MILSKLKQLRKENGFTQKAIAERLHMARSTYTKLEQGKTQMTIEIVKRISCAYNIPIKDIISEESDGENDKQKEDLTMMLFQMDYQLTENLVRTVPYDELSDLQIKKLKEKGLYEREVYESTPLGGRVYKFSPDWIFDFMIRKCGLEVLFKHNLINSELWQNKWRNYQKQIPNYNEIAIDETDYCVSYTFCLNMPGGTERWFEFADRDFPLVNGHHCEWKALERLVDKFGALTGDIMCYSFIGYHTLRESKPSGKCMLIL